MFQSVNPKNQKTYDNEDWVMKALEVQGFVKNANRIFELTDKRRISMQIPTNLIPTCPDDNSDVTTNLRADDYFIEDEGWHKTSENYYEFLQINKDRHILFLELGVGMNTPVIIKKTVLRPYSSGRPLRAHSFRISSGHTDTCVSPIWAFRSKNMHRRD